MIDSIPLTATKQGLAPVIIRRLTLALCIFGLLTACSVDRPDPGTTGTATGSGDADDAMPVQSRVIRGYAVHAHEVRTFRPCAGSSPLWVVGPADKLWSLHKEFLPQPGSQRELFAVIAGRLVDAPADGFGADYAGSVGVETLLYAGLEGPGCDSNWDTFDIKVFGNEPFWTVTLLDDQAKLSRLGYDDVAWRGVARSPLEQGVKFVAGAGAPGAIELEVTRDACRDSMSGSYFAFRAGLRHDGRQLSGCALVGRRSLVP